MALILVVEDNEYNQELLTKFLRRSGHKVVVAADGAAGVKAARQCIPDVILMDLSLPEIDGWEAARQVKANPETAYIPIVALTAHKAPEDVTKAIEAGIDAYETKPVLYERLMKKIAALCATRVV